MTLSRSSENGEVIPTKERQLPLERWLVHTHFVRLCALNSVKLIPVGEKKSKRH